MIRAFTRAVFQLGDPKILKLVIGCALITVMIYIALFVGFGWVLRTTAMASLPWVDTLLDLGAGVAAVVLAWILFPGVVSSLVAIFLDQVVVTVEGQHYAQLGTSRSPPLSETLAMAARLMALTVGLNLMLLPVYLLLVFAPPLNLILFYAVNGKLLGREYFETVALRWHDAATVAALRQRHSGTIWAAGALTAALLTIPGVNLVAPIIGVAAMVHLFHKLTSQD